ncbi:MAG TPA: hypothetical protein VI792_10530 [Candidatus Eisenbacteria bacterium]
MPRPTSHRGAPIRPPRPPAAGTIVLVALAGLLATAGVRAVQAPAVGPIELDAVGRAVQAAVDAHDADVMGHTRARIDTLAAAEPASAGLAYWLAVADWRLAELLLERDTLAAARRAATGEASCARALRTEPSNAEVLALRGGLRMIQTLAPHPGRAGEALEASARADLDRALALAPRNPRAWLFEALATARRRAGASAGAAGPEAALGVFSKAQEMFAAAPPADVGTPDWGWDESFVWAGRCAMAIRNFEFAHLMFTKALEMNPRNGWARHRLLPAAADSLRARDGL